MPTHLHDGALGYLRGLLSRIARANCVRIAERAKRGHDSLTRMLSKSTIDAEGYIATTLVKVFVTLDIGSIIIDDTAVNKEFARAIEGCSWVWSSAKEKTLYGYNIVAICWSNHGRVVPLAWRVYKKASGQTKVDLAVELLVYVKKRLNIEPEYVLFDAFYAADKVLRTCEEYGWKYLGRVKKNRTLDGVQIHELYRHPRWSKEGKLSCKLKARIVRDCKRYFITNDFDLARKEVVDRYLDRWPIETVFRVLHSTVGLDECEARSLASQTNHFALCMLGYYVLESEKTRTGISLYAARHSFKLNPSLTDNALVATFGRCA